MKGLELPIFSHTDETRNLNDAGLNYNYLDCEVSVMRFYRIDITSPEKDDDKLYTAIGSNGSSYICPLNPKKVEELIDKAYREGWL